MFRIRHPNVVQLVSHDQPAGCKAVRSAGKAALRGTAPRSPHLLSLPWLQMGICTMPACIITEFCARGSLYDVLRAAAQDPELAAQLTWDRRLGMAIDAATGMLCVACSCRVALHLCGHVSAARHAR